MNNLEVHNTYDAWIGREEERQEWIHESVMDAMAATLDLEVAPSAGSPLPPGWQWLFFNPAVRSSQLGGDGHPARGGFLPPVELPRRMWAGSRVRYLAPLPVACRATKHSKILKIANKTGKAGALCFVTVEHTILDGATPCIVEEQDIVYREAPPEGAPRPTLERHEAKAQWSREVVPDTTLLFRYSALTFNGHRIHYDQEYARNVEHYPDLVVHGPLTATMLQQFAVDQSNGRRLSEFSFRGVTPLFVTRPFSLEGCKESENKLSLWARGPDGELAMSATATLI